MPTVPGTTTCAGVVIGVAAVSHSGRVRDLTLLDALGWAPGDRTTIGLRDGAILLQRHPKGPHRINNRREAFLPAGARALLGITANTRVLLSANPAHDLLAIYPCALVATLLTDLHSDHHEHRTGRNEHGPTASSAGRPDRPAASTDTQPPQTGASAWLPVVSIQRDTQ